MGTSYREWHERVIRMALPMIARAVRPHPFLGKEDLTQEAGIALWCVWSRYHLRRLPQRDMDRLGLKAVKRRLASQQRRVVDSGEVDCQHVSTEVAEAMADSLDVPVLVVAGLLAESHRSSLSADAYRMLGVLVRPARRLVRMFVNSWRTKARYHSRRTVENGAIGTFLGWSPDRVRLAQAELRRMVRTIFHG